MMPATATPFDTMHPVECSPEEPNAPGIGFFRFTERKE